MNKTRTILIIDDSQEDRELYLRSLKKVPLVDYHCMETASGQRGLDMLEEKPIDCVLLDYSLPGMNGLDILKAIRKKYTFLPIILLTGQGNETVAVEAIKLGASDYLTKSSVTPECLHQAIHATIIQGKMKHSLAEKDLHILEKTQALEQSVAALESARNTQEELIAKLTESNLELERFAYICSHDLQEPLRMISNFSERLEEHLQQTLDEKGRHYLKYVTTGAAQARQLISDVLNYARADHEAEPLGLVHSEKILAGVLRDLASHIEETATTVTHDPLPDMVIQSTHLRQLLQNLISNSIKFCSNKPHVHIGAVQHGAMWQISIRDNGIGIEPEHQEKIFSIFQRLHSREKYSGTGIGLALCKKLVQKYGGTIWVESAPHKGSIFYFTLPHADIHQCQAA